MNSINFKAKYINTAKVLAKCDNGKYKYCNVSFVQMSNTVKDKKVLQDISSTWDAKNNFTETMLIDYLWREHGDEKSLYMLTIQNSDYGKLSYDKVIGLAEITQNGKTYKLNYLQTRPDCKHTRKKRHLRPFKGVGDTMMNEIIKLTKGASIYLNSVPLAINFYKRFGFEVVQDNIENPLMQRVEN